MPTARSPLTQPVVSRRGFTKLAAAFFAGHGFGVRAADGPSDRLNLAVVGVGGRGEANLAGVKDHNVVAISDVDEVRAGRAFESHPRARRCADFRAMFDACEKEIDGVVVSTPDHTHFHPAWWALERDKHLYLEKPLAHEVEEVRRRCDAARTRGLATQLGSQRHALPGLRAGVEFVKAGTIGRVTEVHSWIASGRGMPKPPGAVAQPPATLDWDLWLGPLAERPYRRGRSRPRRASTGSGSTPAGAARPPPATSALRGPSRRACCSPTSPIACRASSPGTPRR